MVTTGVAVTETTVDRTVFMSHLMDRLGVVADETAEHLREVAVANMEARSPYGLTEGETHDSGTIERADEGDLIIRDVKFGGAAKWVEFGRPAGKAPPVEVMREWVGAHLHLEGKERDSVAYLVGQKIAREGIPATFFLLSASDEVYDELAQRVAACVREVME